MTPLYIDGRVPVNVTSLNASVSVQTPYIQQGSGAHVLGVPDPANNDNLAVLTAVQTFSGKTLINPVIQGGQLSSVSLTAPNIISGTLANPIITSGTLTQPVIYCGVIQSAILSTPVIIMTGGQMSGGLINNAVMNGRTLATLAAGSVKTLDFSTADVFIIELNQASTLTITNATTGKAYQVVVKQVLANSYTEISWMTGFVNNFISSGATKSTGAQDYWSIFYDGAKHYGVGAKDVQ